MHAPAACEGARNALTRPGSPPLRSDEVRAQFVGEECSNEHVSYVPGVGPATAKVLKRQGVETVANMVGAFLRLRAPGMTPQQHCDAFAEWLSESGVTANRNTITLVIADKVGSLMPGLGYNVANIAFA